PVGERSSRTELGAERDLSVRVLITGAAGQLGQAIMALTPDDVTVRGVSHKQLDIADAPAVDSVLREFRPDLIINAAGFTRVDDAEKERDAAQRANAIGPAVLAAACRSISVWLVQVSTDYVFDGEQSRPYAPEAPTNPLSVYGTTKLHGEQAVTPALPAHSTVVRTSWVYAAPRRDLLTPIFYLLRRRPHL